MKYLYAVLLLCTSGALIAQDVHFSHVHASPTLTNPAMTGLFDGDLRLVGNFRSQWNNFTKGYQTFAASADTKLFKVGKHDFVGAGVQLYKDVAGDLEFTTSFSALSFSVLKSLDGQGKNLISFGLQSAFINNSVNYNNIISFDDEPLIQGGANDQIRYWDVSAGLGWFYAISKYNMIYMGLSLAHINEPRVSFFEDLNETTTSDILRYRTITIHGGAEIRITNNTTLKPNFVYRDQGPHKEILVGAFWKYKKLKSKFNQPASLYFGGWMRGYIEEDLKGSDSFILAIRFDYKKIYLTFSFDANISKLRKVSAGHGGPELSIMKIFDYRKERIKNKKIICPAFRY